MPSSFKDLVVKARSYRRFLESRPVALDSLTDVVDTARLAPNSINQQLLRYAISVSPEFNAAIFPHLVWATKLKEWKGPGEGERPAAYIIIGGDMANSRNHQVDMGIAAQTLQLGLSDSGLASCMLGSINAKAIHALVGFPDAIGVLLVMAVGYPNETIVVDDLAPGGKSDYWREDNGVHHVPKRRLEDVLLRCFP